MFSSFFSVTPKDEGSVAKQQKQALEDFRQRIGSTKVEEQLRLGGEPGGRDECIGPMSSFDLGHIASRAGRVGLAKRTNKHSGGVIRHMRACRLYTLPFANKKI